MPDEDRRDYLGKIVVRRLVREEAQVEFTEKQLRESAETPTGELENVVGPLGNDTGGGRRVIKSTNSF